MDCNKDEAIRVREIAVCKMRNNDYAAARRFALKAQRLNSNLENVSQILMVCDVHCTPEKKLGTGEMDWHGILQIDRTADDETIRKQFKKFAVQLHPDRNKFPGAESAFKKICDAQDALIYKVNRSSDYKIVEEIDLKPEKKTDCDQAQSNVKINCAGFGSEKLSFYTKCPFCDVRYHYRMKFMRKLIPCQRCSKLFIAFELANSVPVEKTLPIGDLSNVGGEKEATLGRGKRKRERFDVFGCVSEIEIEKMIRQRSRKIIPCDIKSTN